MNWKIDEESHKHFSTLTIKYRTYLDSNTERFTALYSETVKFRIRISSLYLFQGYRRMVNLSPPLRGLRSSMHVPLHLCPLIVDMSSDVMWYSGQSYPVIYRATRSLGLVKRLRCSYVFKQKYSFKGVGISGKFDQYFPVTDLRKTCCSHDHCEPDHWPLTLFSLKFYRSFVSAVWSHRCYSLNVEE